MKMDSQSLSFFADKKRLRLQSLIPTSFARSFCTKSNFDDPGVPYRNITLNKTMDQGSYISGAKLLDFVSMFQRAETSIHVKECTKKFNLQSEPCKKLILPYEQLTTMTLASTHLVGGFVGSKSQVGGTNRGGFGVQIWDIIFDKLVDLMGSAVDSTNSYYEDLFKYEDLNGKISPSDCQTEHMTNKNCSESQKLDCVPHTDTVHSKQSYAEVTKSIQHITPIIEKKSFSYTRCSTPRSKTTSSSSSQQTKKDKPETWQENCNRKVKRKSSNHMNPKSSSHPHHMQSKGLNKLNWRERQDARNLGMEYVMKESMQYHPNRNNKFLEGKRKFMNENKKNGEINKLNTSSCSEIKDSNVNITADPKRQVMEAGNVKQEKEKCCVGKLVNFFQKAEHFPPDLEISDKNCPVIKVGLSFSLSPHEGMTKSDNAGKTADQNERCRFLSECSVDSDDSFVVFDAGGCNETDGSDFAGTDDDYESDSEEDVDDTVWIDDSFPSDDDDEDNCSLAEENYERTVTKRLEDVNARWREDINDSKPKNLSRTKKVRFVEGKSLTSVRPMIVWDYALRSARVGPWETLARDTVRFQNRISRAAAVLDPILQSSHREKIFKERFSNDKT